MLAFTVRRVADYGCWVYPQDGDLLEEGSSKSSTHDFLMVAASSENVYRMWIKRQKILGVTTVSAAQSFLV